MFCCALLYVHSGFAIILMGKRELVALLGLSCWCLVMVVWLFLAVPLVCLRFVFVVFPDHTHLLFLFTVLLMFDPFKAIHDNCHLLSHLLMFFGSLYCKQYETSSDCCLWNSLIWVLSVCYYGKNILGCI